MERDAELFFITLAQLGKTLTQHSSQGFEDRNATHLQFTVLSYVLENPHVKMSDMARELILSVSSSTQVVERLVKAGFIERVADPQDRRIIRLVLTPQGKEEQGRIKKEFVQEIITIFQKIPEKDRKELIRIHLELLITLKNDTI